MNRGVGRLTTTVAGYTTTATGHGVREVSITDIAVGGDRHSSLSCSTFLSATTFAGIRCRITREIRVRVTTITIVVMIEIIVTIVQDTADEMDDEIGVTMDHGVV